MFLTIAICTWNRAKLLNHALDAFNHLRIPKGIEWEILVVNNNCTDDTDNIIKKHAKNLPVKRLYEPQAGKSYALNHAIRKARGEYILWTDDDAIVDKHWVEAYVEAFNMYPNAVFFGGPVEPWFDKDPPKWLNEKTIPVVAPAYAVLNYEEGFHKFTYNKLPYGVNMAVRSKEQSCYFYNTNYGPRPNSELRGEEWLLMHKLLDDGHEGKWIPKAKVRHYIQPNRMTIKYLKNYYKAQGELSWIEISNGTSPNRFGSIGNMVKTAVYNELRTHYHRLFSSTNRWLGALQSSSIAWGRLKCRLKTNSQF